MTDQEINIAITEVCGWKPIDDEIVKQRAGNAAWLLKQGPWWRNAEENTIATADELPDYCNDLNAMHEVELTLTLAQRRKYLSILGEGETPIDMAYAFCVFATARERAKAFLKTLDIWKS